MRAIASVLFLAAASAALQWIPVPKVKYLTEVSSTKTNVELDQCTEPCEKDPWCVGVIYQESTKTCKIHAHFSGNPVIDITWTIYVPGDRTTVLNGIYPWVTFVASLPQQNNQVDCVNLCYQTANCEWAVYHPLSKVCLAKKNNGGYEIEIDYTWVLMITKVRRTTTTSTTTFTTTSTTSSRTTSTTTFSTSTSTTTTFTTSTSTSTSSTTNTSPTTSTETSTTTFTSSTSSTSSTSTTSITSSTSTTRTTSTLSTTSASSSATLNTSTGTTLPTLNALASSISVFSTSQSSQLTAIPKQEYPTTTTATLSSALPKPTECADLKAAFPSVDYQFDCTNISPNGKYIVPGLKKVLNQRGERRVDQGKYVLFEGYRVVHVVFPRMALAQEVPKSIGSFAALQIIDLSGNNLVGAIPTQIGALLSLTTINLSGNQISGGIPSQIGQLKGLQLIELSQNQLVGSIPTQLAQLPNIKALSLAGNQLTGVIPQILLQNIAKKGASVSLGTNCLIGQSNQRSNCRSKSPDCRAISLDSGYLDTRWNRLWTALNNVNEDMNAFDKAVNEMGYSYFGVHEYEFQAFRYYAIRRKWCKANNPSFFNNV